MKEIEPGMSTYHGQEKDRKAWGKAMQERHKIIKKIEKHGVRKSIDLNRMSTKDLEELLKEKEAQYKAWMERRKRRSEV